MTNTEKFDSQSYRDDLARRIQDKPDKEKRREILDTAKETTEYKNAKSEKREWSGAKFLAELTNYHNPNLVHQPEGSHGVFLHRIDNANATEQVFNKYGDQFAKNWKMIMEDSSERETALIKLIQDKVTDKVMIDLGGGITQDERGHNAPSFMQRVAEKLGASVYVNADRHLGVEVSYPNARPRDNTKELEIEQPPSGMHVIYTENDLLNFLSKMNTESPDVVIAINGIDDMVINESHIPDYDWNKRGRWYHKRVAEEVARVLPRGSVVLSAASEAPKYFEGLGLKLLQRLDMGIFTLDVWTKE